ncbi:hypothetical protein N374_gp212 [Bacillus phage phiNIT1]|uniref:Uncharacterized protein n=1 Tax=Bacillus phage phiNIT1 TaxID=207656 RepID=S6BUU0_9CAUD|nr:hypothetical protein N374_gp212 [Bacillus phage phiNIT1]BAN59565.1 hypothetical protein [Bacillus phage phiNIT1]
MALPSIDTYLYKEIAEKLEIILSNRYIIEEILKEVQPEVSTSFIERFTGDRRWEIPIVYTMPQINSPKGEPFILVSEKGKNLSLAWVTWKTPTISKKGTCIKRNL